MMGLGAILFSRQNRRCRKSAPNSNIMGENVDKKRRFSAEHPANLFRAGSASYGVSWRFRVSLMTARCCVRAPICVPAGANRCRERTPRQIANLTTTTHAAGPLSSSISGLEGGPFVPLCGHYGETAALWLPYRGLEGGLLSRYVAIMTRRPPSGSHIGGCRAALCPGKASIMPTMAALWLPLRGWRAAFCPGNATIMATIMLPSSSIMGLEGGFLSPICGHYGDDHGAKHAHCTCVDQATHRRQ